MSILPGDITDNIKPTDSYIDEFSRTAGRIEFRGTDSSDAIIGNPIQAYQLVKRLTVDWADLQKAMMKQDDWQNVQDLVNEYQELLPNEEDLKGAALAIVRLADTYKLNMTDVSKGIIMNLRTKVQLTARDCLYLGKHSFNSGYYGQAIEWFQTALNKAHKEGNNTAPVDEIAPFYNMAVQIHNDLFEDYWTNITTTGDSPPPHTMRFVDGDNDDFRNYQALCRGENLKTPNDTKHLKCYYSNMNSKWLILQPVKVEVFNKFPYIVMFHQLLSDKESDAIRELSAPALTRAKVQTDSMKEDEISDTRTSQTTWFSEDDNEMVSRINLRVSEVTGLSTKMSESHSELMQVANYGMGGHYTPHYDYLIVDRPPEERHLVAPREAYAGDRTATLMFYLSNVGKGGATVFPRLGVRLTPQKNSAAFWYNLYRNGEAIVDTVHGACPVLMGEKWVANHWIREIGQAFRRRCTLNPNE